MNIKSLARYALPIKASCTLIGISLALVTLSTLQSSRAITYEQLGDMFQDAVDGITKGVENDRDVSIPDYQEYQRQVEKIYDRYDADLKFVDNLRFPQNVDSILSRFGRVPDYTSGYGNYFQYEYGARTIGFWHRNGRVTRYVAR